MCVSEFPTSILKHFPPVEHAFAYGSGVFDQPDLYTSAQRASGAGPMIDLILLVKDPLAWHQEVLHGSNLLNNVL